jgi:hypothetical protein
VLYGPYWSHVIDGWNHRFDSNVHFMFYENSKHDMENSLRKLSEFLECPLNDKDLPKLMEHLQFENVQKNPSINFKFQTSEKSNNEFVRRGKVGGNPEITDEISEKIDQWSKSHFEVSGIEFPFC